MANLAFAQSAKKKAPPNLQPFLVEDIYPGKTGSEPNYLVDFKGRLLFAANHPEFGEELWRSNGTKSGTRLVKDIDPGPLVINEVEDTETGSSAPDNVLRTKEVDLLPGHHRQVRRGAVEERRDQGWHQGCQGHRPRPGLFGCRRLRVHSPRTTFFRAWDKKHGEELWKTDGTEKGTTLIKDINPDLPPGARCDQGECGIPKGWSHPDTVTVMGKQVFFAADDGKHGVELWKSDGTEKGTTLVKDINTVKGNSNPNDKGDALNPQRGGRKAVCRRQDALLQGKRWQTRRRAVEERRNREGAPRWSRTSTLPLPTPSTPPARDGRAAPAVRGSMT